MSRRWVEGARWLALGAALFAPALAVAEPAAPADAAPGVARTEESRIERMIKTAEREGFERHELERALSIYAPDGVWILGRRAVPDEHDVRLSLDKLRSRLGLRFANPLTGQEQVFFRDVEVELEGDAATMTATVLLDLFTGREELKHRYRLVRAGERWQVVELRVWPVMRSHVGLPTFYTDEHWIEAEKQLETLLADPGSRLESRLTAFNQAGHLKRGYDEARAHTRKAPDDPLGWRARAMFALEMGEAEDALASARKAVALAPDIGLPLTLEPLVRTKAAAPAPAGGR